MKVYEIVFSPTGGTKKAADIIASGLSDGYEVIDLCREHKGISLAEGDTAVIAVPSFGGRVPSVAAERIAGINGGGAEAVLVWVYGNRAYEDTLIELRDTADKAGFRVMAAVAAVAEHSIAHQYAAGRPDESDREVLSGFAEKIAEKLAKNDTSEPEIPGNRPYKKAGGAGAVPKPTKDCTKCGICARECPVNAIDAADPKKVKGCISCMRCTAVCPHSARKLSPVLLAGVGLALKKACSDRKENELFI